MPRDGCFIGGLSTISSVTPVYLAGGAGRRLYPLSRSARPKPFIRPFFKESFLQYALQRGAGMKKPMIVCNRAHYDLARRQEGGWARYILEPAGRNTAPALAAISYYLRDEAGPVLVMPTDHMIADLSFFHRAVERATFFAQKGYVVTFGITPRYPATGYGYIRKGESLGGGGYKVSAFTEKPAKVRAQDYMESGDYLWNSGIFMFCACDLWQEMNHLCPDLCAAVRKTVDSGQKEGDALFLPDELFCALPTISFDCAVMEHTKKAAVLPVDIKWNDLGTWRSYLGFMMSNLKHFA